MRYRVYIRTRDFNTDYRWLGDQPEEWWKGHPAAGIVVNQRGILRVGDNWLLTGIPTDKEDSIGTSITKDLALVPDANGTISDNDLLSLINEVTPDWINSPHTLVTDAFSVYSPLLTTEVRAKLSALNSRDTASPVKASPPSGLKSSAGGGGCLIGLLGLLLPVAVCLRALHE